MTWVRYEPKAQMRVLNRIFPEGIHDPRLLLRQEHRPPADDEVPHLHDDDRRDEERVRRAAEHAAALHAFVDSRDAGRSAGDPEGDPLRACSRSWTARPPATARGRARCIPVVKNVMLASADQVAIDAVSAKMMGFDPMSLEYIRLAHEDGLGVGDPREIEIVGDADAANENWQFHVGKNLVAHRRRRPDLVRSAEAVPEAVLPHAARATASSSASDVYHDFYRWPLLDRRVFERWCETTAWGQLFLRYAQMGPQGAPALPAAAADDRPRVHSRPLSRPELQLGRSRYQGPSSARAPLGSRLTYGRACIARALSLIHHDHRREAQGGARRYRRDLVGDLLSRRRSRRARVLRLRHPRSRPARDVRRGLLPAVAPAAADARRARRSAVAAGRRPRAARTGAPPDAHAAGRATAWTRCGR